MNADFSYALESLERRWQHEKTPQVGLRLAEQYRRKGDLSATIEVLSAGIEIYPTHTASRVALSRYLVDAGRFDEAVPHLEQIVARDPSHLVANKLLVSAFAGVGRIDAARDKLAIYEMIGEGDADIEVLHELLATAEGGGILPNDAPLGSAAPKDVSEEIERGTDLPVGQASGPPDSVSPVSRTAGVPSTPPEGAEPFGPALAPGDSSNYWQGIADEGIFVLETPSQPTIEAAGAEEAVAAGDSTVTLGELYLEQGHREEAGEAFKEVLTREPRNEAAQRGLEVTRELPLGTAPGESLGGDAEASKGGSAQGSVERKKLTLAAYLDRIRQAVAAGI